MPCLGQVPHLRIGGREIGPSRPTYIVAELSANHRQQFDEAVQLIHAAKQAGADAVKVQTYLPETLTLDSSEPIFRIGPGSLWSGRTLYELYREAYMPWEWQPRLKEMADDLGLDFFSTPFDPSSVDFLETIGVGVYKIASFELVDIPLIVHAARTGKPLILSTGMATLAEIEEAVNAAMRAGAPQVALLKCTSSYPAPPDAMNLRTIPHLAETFRVPVGLSDHTLGIAVPVAAVALGASIIEKHFTLSRSAGGSDSAFSLEPEEFRAMVEAVRTVEKALGEVRYGPGEHEQQSVAHRRSLFVVRDVRAGEPFTTDNVRSIRPGLGMHPRHLPDVIGRVATKDIKGGTPLTWDLVAGPSLLS